MTPEVMRQQAELIRRREDQALAEQSAALALRSRLCPYCRRGNCPSDPCSTELMRRAHSQQSSSNETSTQETP
jgi:hypothetical protein